MALLGTMYEVQVGANSLSSIIEDKNHDYKPKRLLRENDLELNNHNHNSMKDFNRSLITFIIKSKKKSPYKWTTKRDDDNFSRQSNLFHLGIIFSSDQKRILNQIDTKIDTIRRYKKKKPFKWG
jgi:hypothetical protein